MILWDTDMRYHVKLEPGQGTPHYWWNLSKEKFITDLLLPYISRQIVIVKSGGQKRLLNMGNVSLFTAYKTTARLSGTPSSRIPKELKDLKFQQEHCCTRDIINEVKIAQANVASRSLIQKALVPPKPQVFVIMKFSDRLLDSAYDGVMAPVIREFGLNPIRIDEVQDSGQISDQVLDCIATSKYVLVDLTGERPNCYYECGFAHALGKNLILTIREKEPIHFDLAGYRFIQWGTESDLRHKLRKRLKSLEEPRQD